jgi:hypothetical protein
MGHGPGCSVGDAGEADLAAPAEMTNRYLLAAAAAAAAAVRFQPAVAGKAEGSAHRAEGRHPVALAA